MKKKAILIRFDHLAVDRQEDIYKLLNDLQARIKDYEPSIAIIADGKIEVIDLEAEK